MRPYLYSDFLSTYVKSIFSDRNVPVNEQFLEELYAYISANKDTCVNKYGEFLESTIHATVVFNYLKHYFIHDCLDNEKYSFLVRLASEKQLKSLSANLLYTGDFTNRIERALYETYALN
jgi:hypothetical protein